MGWGQPAAGSPRSDRGVRATGKRRPRSLSPSHRGAWLVVEERGDAEGGEGILGEVFALLYAHCQRRVAHGASPTRVTNKAQAEATTMREQN